MGSPVILVTGGTGFVGKHLVRRLLQKNFSVVVLARKSSDLSIFSELNIEVCFIEDGVAPIFENNIFGIVHVATSYGQAQSLSDIFYTNVILPLLLLEEGVKNRVSFFINTDTFFTKSSGEYLYLNNYTKSKLLIADLIKQFSSNVKIVNLKLEHVYGENDNQQKFIVQIMKRLKSNEPYVDLTDGLQRRDFIYIDDVVSAYLTVINSIDILKGFTEIEVGTGISTSIREAVEIIHTCTKSSSILNFGALPKRSGEFIESKANLQILLSLGWKSKYDFKTGVKRILELEN
jgi:nucleoside-diphosphate-sugar epimerase